MDHTASPPLPPPSITTIWLLNFFFLWNNGQYTESAWSVVLSLSLSSDSSVLYPHLLARLLSETQFWQKTNFSLSPIFFFACPLFLLSALPYGPSSTFFFVRNLKTNNTIFRDQLSITSRLFARRFLIFGPVSLLTMILLLSSAILDLPPLPPPSVLLIFHSFQGWVKWIVAWRSLIWIIIYLSLLINYNVTDYSCCCCLPTVGRVLTGNETLPLEKICSACSEDGIGDGGGN